MLGNLCAVCGTDEGLTLDCIKPIKQAQHGQGHIGRQWFYWREMRRGNIQVLCSTCQALKGSRSQEDFLTALTKGNGDGSVTIPIKGTEQVQQLRKKPSGNLLPRREW